MLHLAQIILSCVSLTVTCVIGDLVVNNFNKVAGGRGGAVLRPLTSALLTGQRQKTRASLDQVATSSHLVIRTITSLGYGPWLSFLQCLKDVS
jgi:hypothetical protein